MTMHDISPQLETLLDEQAALIEHYQRNAAHDAQQERRRAANRSALLNFPGLLLGLLLGLALFVIGTGLLP